MNNLSELLRPFDYGTHKWRVMNITKAKDKASVAFYIDARDVMDRLDEVAGAENWTDKYTVLAYSESRWAVECTLVVNGVAKSDVGEGDAPKDAYSDALKRAAVKFGVGRYLYDMDTGTWFPIDTYGKFTSEAEQKITNLLYQNLTRLHAKNPAPGSKDVPPAPPAVTTVTGAGDKPEGNGNGHKPAPYTGADVFKVRYPAAKEKARKSGKFTTENHLTNAWGMLFKEYNAHEAANADMFLTAWNAYVEAHGPEGVPSVADSEPMAV
jgi:hypothetical protein